MSVPTAKDKLRHEIRAHLRAMSPVAHAEASLAICRTVENLAEFRSGKCLALFAPLPSEPDIHPLIEKAWTSGKRVALPFMIPLGPGAPRLEWHEVTGWHDVMGRGPQGLREPDPVRCPRVATRELSCVFVPGVAFDMQGGRLGRGGGFYDRFLEQAPATLPRIGLFFRVQKVETVPVEPHDQSLGSVVTEDGYSPIIAL